VIPWKYGFNEYIDSYRSQQRRKNKEQARLRRLEEQLLSNDARMANEVKRQVAITMSQQQQSQPAPVPNVNEANVSQRISSCASTDLPINNAIFPIVETGQQRYPVDDITQRTPCVLQSKHKGIIFTVDCGTAMPTQPRDVYIG
jgi:hypothetical protein